MGVKFFVSDCEGPISLNDNAFELAGHFIMDGEKFFERVSKYDDVLVDVLKRPGYNAGDTLKLIVPFLKAYGATNRNIIDFSEDNVQIIQGALETLEFVESTMPSYIVSTSYNHYIRALCNKTGFPFENTYSTSLDMDVLDIKPEEAELIKDYKDQIVKNPEFEVLDEIFWKKIPKMHISKLMEGVKTVGGEGKREAVLDIIDKNGFKSSDLFYIGDSITDVEPLQFAKEEGGIAVSFNGNEYAIKEAEIAVISYNTTVTTLLADIFNQYGTDGVHEFTREYSHDHYSALKSSLVDPEIRKNLKKGVLPKIEIITPDNIERIIDQSSSFRKKLRGESIGALG